MIEKLISGGQTGADRAGLDAAKILGIPTGGTAPKGWRICNPDGTDGSDPTLAEFGLVESDSREYRDRTIQNVQDSDATVWYGFQDSPGGKLTLSTAKRLNKPAIVNPTPQQLRQWVEGNSIKILNVAGNRFSTHNPDIYDLVYRSIMYAFSESNEPKT